MLESKLESHVIDIFTGEDMENIDIVNITSKVAFPRVGFFTICSRECHLKLKFSLVPPKNYNVPFFPKLTCSLFPASY
jgi:hypothetical protein